MGFVSEWDISNHFSTHGALFMKGFSTFLNKTNQEPLH